MDSNEDLPDDPFLEEEKNPDPLVALGSILILLLCSGAIFVWLIMFFDILRHL